MAEDTIMRTAERLTLPQEVQLVTSAWRTPILLVLVFLVSWIVQAEGLKQTATASQPSSQSASSSTPAISSVPADSTQLEVIRSPQPDYPLEAATKGLQGKVVIRLHISETGDVASTEIISGDPVLAKAAENGMKQWKFKPFIKDGKPVRISKDIPYEYIVKGKAADGCALVEAASRSNQAHRLPQVPQEVAEGRLVHKVEPPYPLIARQKHIQGTVMLEAIIGKDGRIRDLKPLCGAPELVQSSLSAIRQWRYSPYLLEGNAVEVETTITVRFHM